jgi:hypothetical protein
LPLNEAIRYQLSAISRSRRGTDRPIAVVAQ